MRKVKLPSTEFAALSADVFERGGCLRFQVRGGSMWPTIQAGDVVTIQPVEAETLTVFEVILYQKANGNLSLHRIIGTDCLKGEWVLLARGDAHCGPAEVVFAKQVLGKVVALRRGRRKTRLYRGMRWMWLLVWPRMMRLVMLFPSLSGTL